jgi:hypothetical protein
VKHFSRLSAFSAFLDQFLQQIMNFFSHILARELRNKFENSLSRVVVGLCDDLINRQRPQSHNLIQQMKQENEEKLLTSA